MKRCCYIYTSWDKRSILSTSGFGYRLPSLIYLMHYVDEHSQSFCHVAGVRSGVIYLCKPRRGQCHGYQLLIMIKVGLLWRPFQGEGRPDGNGEWGREINGRGWNWREAGERSERWDTKIGRNDECMVKERDLQRGGKWMEEKWRKRKILYISCSNFLLQKT